MATKTLKLSLICLVITTGIYGQYPFLEEFRGVWVATVFNIDWPASPHQSLSEQKTSYEEILQFYDSLNFNSIIFQIRTAGDALYDTKLAPFSRYISGVEGSNGVWKKDPLDFLIEKTHEYGFEFHAWINPYRATMNNDSTILSNEHVFYTHPEWIVQYGDKYYLNPGIPEVRAYIFAIIDEVVRKYEIDGIHMDDYFYPYTIEGQYFDDTLAFAKYGTSFDDISSWRRANVDSLVSGIATVIRKRKPWIKFGISPFGVWRNREDDPRGSNTEATQTNYDNLYCDPLLWAEKGWIDYLAPQLYWSRSFAKASYDTLAHWWGRECGKVTLYSGIGAYKVENNWDTAWYDLSEVPSQMELNRSIENIQGEIFFSAKSLRHHSKLSSNIVNTFYSKKALPSLNNNLSSNSTWTDLYRIRSNATSIKGKVRKKRRPPHQSLSTK